MIIVLEKSLLLGPMISLYNFFENTMVQGDALDALTNEAE